MVVPIVIAGIIVGFAATAWIVSSVTSWLKQQGLTEQVKDTTSCVQTLRESGRTDLADQCFETSEQATSATVSTGFLGNIEGMLPLILVIMMLGLIKK